MNTSQGHEARAAPRLRAKPGERTPPAGWMITPAGVASSPAPVLRLSATISSSPARVSMRSRRSTRLTRSASLPRKGTTTDTAGRPRATPAEPLSLYAGERGFVRVALSLEQRQRALVVVEVAHDPHPSRAGTATKLLAAIRVAGPDRRGDARTGCGAVAQLTVLGDRGGQIDRRHLLLQQARLEVTAQDQQLAAGGTPGPAASCVAECEPVPCPGEADEAGPSARAVGREHRADSVAVGIGAHDDRVRADAVQHRDPGVPR